MISLPWWLHCNTITQQIEDVNERTRVQRCFEDVWFHKHIRKLYKYILWTVILCINHLCSLIFKARRVAELNFTVSETIKWLFNHYHFDLEVMSSNTGRVELGVLSTSVPSRTWTKNIYICIWNLICLHLPTDCFIEMPRCLERYLYETVLEECPGNWTKA